MKKFFNWFILSFNILFVISGLAISLFIFSNTKDIRFSAIATFETPLKSKIYDDSSLLVETLGENKEEFVKYEDIPINLINALISIEDINFYEHKGLDYSRLLKATIKNILYNSKEGGSTITQQLAKNLFLSSEQTYERKIKEAYIALQIEKEYSKEEILTFYFNNIYFEQSIPGVGYASKRYFGKSVNLLTLPECAMLAGIVKSASYYNPFKYVDRVNERKNLVLKKMYEYNLITTNEYDVSKKIHVKDLVIEQGALYKEPTYAYQSYLDIVYLELKKLGFDPYKQKIKVETYLDTTLQTFLDEIQKGNVVTFKDDEQQIGGSVINNKNGTIVGVLGGRNYNGSHIFSHAYSLKRQPASTIKPIFEYLLACEYLNYNAVTNLVDEPYFYPGTNKQVLNADRIYQGNITLIEALGYSKNTCALKTLEQVENKISTSKVIQYLESIDLMDDGNYGLSYGIGGMTYGISPVKLSAAYSILNRDGKYIAPTTIKRITSLDNNEILYEHKEKMTQVVSEESAFQIQYALRQVVKNNYYGIGIINSNNDDIGAKTGTNAYDKATIKKLNYPSYADKDSWIAGFNKNYTIAIWSGFDKAEKDGNDYFGRNDERRKIPKYIFKNILNFLKNKKSTYEVPSSLQKQYIVKGVDGTYIPNKLVPSSYVVEGYFKKDEMTYNILPLPKFPSVYDIKVFNFNDEYILMFEHDKYENDIFNYQKIYGQKGFFIKYKTDDKEEILFTTNNMIELKSDKKIREFEIIPGFKNDITISSKSYFFNPS
ncbi:MAG: transglycosylase domain-containing protein [Bacilli bacterium]|nr:transglycosylase domain-containing protein [Bacilli bacterium]